MEGFWVVTFGLTIDVRAVHQLRIYSTVKIVLLISFLMMMIAFKNLKIIMTNLSSILIMTNLKHWLIILLWCQIKMTVITGVENIPSLLEKFSIVKLTKFLINFLRPLSKSKKLKRVKLKMKMLRLMIKTQMIKNQKNQIKKEIKMKQ